MANNYAQFSEEMVVPVDKVAAVNAFFEQYIKDIDDGQFDYFGGIETEWDKFQPADQPAIWLHADESYMDEELFYVVQGLLKAIESDQPFIVNVAYTCSKPRVGEFSGGCYAIWQDKDYYVDPCSAVMDYIKFHDGKPE
jgi:hypothetical protein